MNLRPAVSLLIRVQSAEAKTQKSPGSVIALVDSRPAAPSKEAMKARARFPTRQRFVFSDDQKLAHLDQRGGTETLPGVFAPSSALAIR